VADPDIDEEAGNESAEPKARAGGGIVKSLLSGVGIFAAVLLAQIAAPPINQMIYGDPNAPVDDVEAADAEALEVVAVAAVPAEPVNLDPALYVPLDPALVVSLSSVSGQSHFLQINVQAMTRDQDHATAIRDHAPALRNSFLFVISKQTYEDILTSEGKENLRRAMLAEAQEVMRRNVGEPGIEELYFTSFVVQ
jgi:flagellar FliL protein